MTARFRIRPRIWTTGGAVRTPWLWTPLALIFRKRRLMPRPAPASPAGLPQAIHPVSFFARHLHYHTQEGARILPRGEMRETVVREQSRVAAPNGTESARPASANPVPPLHPRERATDTRLRLRVMQDVAHVNTRILRIERIAGETEVTRLKRQAAPAVEAIVAAAKRQFRTRPPAWPAAADRVSAPRVRFIERTAETRMEPPQSKAARETPRRWRAAEPPRVTETHAAFGAPLPAQQVWRVQQPPRDQAVETMRTPSAAMAQASPTLSMSAAAPAPRGFVAPHPAARSLEGPEIDRLADNVMKRIERRVRIERERRGR